MKKLYIITYDDNSFSWAWSNTKQRAVDYCLKADEKNNIDVDEVIEIDGAINRNEVKEALERYIIKPLKK